MFSSPSSSQSMIPRWATPSKPTTTSIQYSRWSRPCNFRARLRAKPRLCLAMQTLWVLLRPNQASLSLASTVRPHKIVSCSWQTLKRALASRYLSRRSNKTLRQERCRLKGSSRVARVVAPVTATPAALTRLQTMRKLNLSWRKRQLTLKLWA